MSTILTRLNVKLSLLTFADFLVFELANSDNVVCFNEHIIYDFFLDIYIGIFSLFTLSFFF